MCPDVDRLVVWKEDAEKYNFEVRPWREAVLIVDYSKRSNDEWHKNYVGLVLE